MQPKIYMKIANVLSSTAEFLTPVVVVVADDDGCVISGRGPWPGWEPVRRLELAFGPA